MKTERFITLLLLTCISVTKQTQQQASLVVPRAGNCQDDVTIECKVSGNISDTNRRWFLNGTLIISRGMPQGNTEPSKYVENIGEKNFKLTIKSFSKDDDGNYECRNDFEFSVGIHLPFECKAKNATVHVNSEKKIEAKISNIYPVAHLIVQFSAEINGQNSAVIDGSLKLATSRSQDLQLYDALWMSNIAVTVDGYYNYSIIVKTITYSDPISGFFKISPPSGPVIKFSEVLDGRVVIRATENQHTVLKCVSTGGYPEPKLTWLKGSSHEHLGNSTTVFEEDQTYTVTNVYTYKPAAKDDLTVYTCQSYYSVVGDMPKTATAVLYLNLKPSPPVLSNMITVAAGATVNITCVTTQARPAANISWSYKRLSTQPKFMVQKNYSKETFTSTSVFQLQSQRYDNGEILKCIVSHPTLQTPLTASTTLSVHFAPLTLSLTGNQQMVANGQNKMNLTCTTDYANPKATTTWHNGTLNITSGVNESYKNGDYGGFVTIGWLQFSPTRDMDGAVISCKAKNSVNEGTPLWNETILDLLYSPRVVITEPSTMTVNESNLDVKFHCYVKSKPSSNFSWFHGDRSLSDSYFTSNENLSIYTIASVDRMNYGNYTCSASNGIDTGAEDSVHLDINFKPLAVHIIGNQNIVADGKNKLTLTCKTDSCVPEATIYWKHNTSVLPNTSPVTPESGIYGGKNYSQKLTFVPSRLMDGDNISCEAFNQLSGNYHAEVSVTLDLKYSPIVTAEERPLKTVVEGQPNVMLVCKADSKPAANISWFKGDDKDPLRMGYSSVFNNMLSYSISKVKRSDAGDYRCTAENGIGNSNNSNGLIRLVVQYPPDIMLNATNTTVNATDLPEIKCIANGVPATYTFLAWRQSWYETGDIIREFSLQDDAGLADKQILKFFSSSYQDTGFYSCGAKNNISFWGTSEMEVRKSIYFIVESHPVITSPTSSEERPYFIAVGLNEPFTLNVSVYSNVDLLDTHLYREINISDDTNLTFSYLTDKHLSITRVMNFKYEVNHGLVFLQVYNKTVETSGYILSLKLKIKQSGEFGRYLLRIPNVVGTTDFSFETIAKGPPCIPENPSIDGYGSSDITVSWIPCFHGGSPQTFVIQYSTDNTVWNDEQHKVGGLSTSRERIASTIGGLSPATQYYIRVYAFNMEGRSKFTETLNVTTESSEEDLDPANVGLIAGGAAGGVGLAVIILIGSLVVVWKRKHILKNPKGSFLQEMERSGENEMDSTNMDLPDINLNPMYESAGPLTSSSANTDVYSQVVKTKKQTQAFGDIYSQVNKPASHDKGESYAAVNKKGNAVKNNKKKQKEDKTTKKKKFFEGAVYDNVQPAITVPKQSENVYENPSCSTEDEKPKRILNEDGLIYVEVELPKASEGATRTAVIHGADNRTDYAEIRFREIGEQAPESDDDKDIVK